MNNKGLTLVELIAVLIILSVIALVVTPNIMVSIKQYQQQLYDTEISALESAAKNWTADNVDTLPSESDSAIAIGIKELIDGGYYDENAVDPKGGKFDDDKHQTFVIVTCEMIEDKYHVIETNYKYKYEAYTSFKEYIEKKAIEYVKALIRNGTITSSNFVNSHYTKRVSLNNLLEPPAGVPIIGGIDYIKNNILYYDGLSNENTLVLPRNAAVDIEIVKKGKTTITYEYEAKNYTEA